MEERFLHITTEELACDPAFIALVRSENGITKLNEWIANYPTQKAKVEMAIVLANLPFEKTQEIDRSALWSRIKDSIDGTENIKSIHAWRKYKWVGWAAASLLILFFIIPTWNDSGSKRIFASVPESFFLPDQSQVYLNGESSMVYDESNWSSERKLHLDGEAFFSVAKGKKFTVETKIGTVDVLGTSFNVYQRNGQLKVECETGKVRVIISDSRKSFILNPSEAISIEEGKEPLTFKILAGQNRSDWRQGRYHFRDHTLDDVFKEMQKVYNIEIEYSKNISELRYTGSFDHTDLEKAMESVLYPMRLQHKKDGKRILIINEK